VSSNEGSQEIIVEGIVAQRNHWPYVVLSINGMRAQLSMAQARSVARDIERMASRTEADAMILKFFKRSEFPEGAAAALMHDFRDVRHQWDAEPVVTFQDVPTEGEPDAKP
jgi:hypothetical protein